MIHLIERNLEHNYSLYLSDYIIEYNDVVKSNCFYAHKRFEHLFTESDSTWTYNRYNLFTLTATSSCFYKIYKDLIFCVKDYLNNQEINQEFMWIQSWINFHKQNKVLDWHDHHWPFHGYISIDPKKSQTVFNNFTIKNEIGYIYIGEGNKPHKVEVLEPFEGERITLGYDITLTPDTSTENLSLIPVI